MTEESDEHLPLENDLSIPPEEVLYRRLDYHGGNWVVSNQISGDRRPSSGGFTHDTDGVSVFRETVLLAQDPPLGPADVGEIVVGFTVADVRGLSLGVKSDPWPKDVQDPEHPRYAAHVLITGLDMLGKKARIRCQKDLSSVRSMTFVHG